MQKYSQQIVSHHFHPVEKPNVAQSLAVMTGNRQPGLTQDDQITELRELVSNICDSGRSTGLKKNPLKIANK